MRWFGHLVRVGVRVRGSIPPVGGPQEEPGHAGGTMSLGWPGNASRSPPEELDEVAGERKVSPKSPQLNVMLPNDKTYLIK